MPQSPRLAAAEPTSTATPATASSRLPRSPAVAKAKEREPGVVHFPQLPPFMMPEKVKHILEEYGEVLKVFLEPEEKFRQDFRRKIKARQGGSSSGRIKYVEGWVQFADKRVAKHVAKRLNLRKVTRQVGGRHFAEDVWHILYLSGFKWSDIRAEEVEKRLERKERLRARVRRGEQAIDSVRNLLSSSATQEEDAKHDGEGASPSARATADGKAKAQKPSATPVTRPADLRVSRLTLRSLFGAPVVVAAAARGAAPGLSRARTC